MATSHEIRNGLDSSESNMGVGRATNREKSATLQIGFSVQICIRLGKTQIQSSARHEGLQTTTWGRLRRDIFACSQDGMTTVKRLHCTTTSHEEECINKDIVRVEGPTKRRRQEEKRLRDVQV